MKVTLKHLSESELSEFWELAFSDEQAEWTKWNGPYFHDKLPTKADFLDLGKNTYLNNCFSKVIYVDDDMVGYVGAYYEDEPLNRWLDIGIIIYKDDQWHQGIGKQALKMWIDELFKMVDLPHIGLTTWSGNYRMMALAESLNLKKEAEIRKVRFWDGKYWDSVKYGVLRDEWMN